MVHEYEMDKLKPPNLDDQARWEYTAARRAIMENEHAEAVRQAAQLRMGTKRTEVVVQEADISVNLAENTCGSLAVMYSSAPILSRPGATASEVEEVTEMLSRAAIWPLMDTIQTDTLGLRECGLHLSVDEDGEIDPRIAYPDCSIATPGRFHADRPRRWIEARKRTVDDKSMWLWDVTEHTDAGTLYYVTRDLKPGAERLTSEFSPDGIDENGFVGAYRMSDGTPFLPYVMYRAAKTTKMWNPRGWHGLFAGTVRASVDRTYQGHCLMQAAWKQKLLINGTLMGAVNGKVTVDPAVVAQIIALDDSKPVQYGEWSSATDPREMLLGIFEFEDGVIRSIGIDPAAVLRTSSDPRSGLAMSVSMQAQRDAQKRWMPLFRSADLEMVSKAVAMHNRVTGKNLPEDGWRIEYTSLPRTETEKRAHQDRIFEQQDRGMLSAAEVYCELNPGCDVESAKDKLALIAAEQEAVAPTETASREPSVEAPAGVSTSEAAVAELEEVKRLNGAQYSSMLETISMVAQGALTVDMAVEALMQGLAFTESDARSLLRGVESITIPAPQEPTNGA